MYFCSILCFIESFKKKPFFHTRKNKNMATDKTYAEYFKEHKKGNKENRVQVTLTQWVFDLRFTYKYINRLIWKYLC
jgi:hypothetical protein